MTTEEVKQSILERIKYFDWLEDTPMNADPECDTSMYDFLYGMVDTALDRYVEAIRKERVEHCSEPSCPECNKAAYEAGVKAERERHDKKVVLYVDNVSSYSDMSHEDRIKANANEVIIYLGNTTKDVWGDDWNDAPDESNSGIPYKETVDGLETIVVTLGKPLTQSTL